MNACHYSMGRVLTFTPSDFLNIEENQNSENDKMRIASVRENLSDILRQTISLQTKKIDQTCQIHKVLEDELLKSIIRD